MAIHKNPRFYPSYLIWPLVYGNTVTQELFSLVMYKLFRCKFMASCSNIFNLTVYRTSVVNIAISTQYKGHCIRIIMWIQVGLQAVHHVRLYSSKR